MKGYEGRQIIYSIEGYVGGSAGTDRSQPDAVAVTLRVPHNKRSSVLETEITGNLYQQFRHQGILGEDMQFRLDTYADGSIFVVPIDSPLRRARLSPELERLSKLQAQKRKEAGLKS